MTTLLLSTAREALVELPAQDLFPLRLLLALLADAEEDVEAALCGAQHFLVEYTVSGRGVGDASFGEGVVVEVALLAVAYDDALAAEGCGGAGGAQGGEGAEVAAHGGVCAVHALATDLDGAAGNLGSDCA